MVNVTETSYTFKQLNAGTDYDYMVRSVDPVLGTGEFSPAQTITTQAGAPVLHGLGALAKGERINITWDAMAGVDGYMVMLDGEVFFTTDPFWTIIERLPRTGHDVAVAAVIDGEIGMYTPIKRVGTAPPPPKIVKVDTTNDSLTITWDKVEGALDYTVIVRPTNPRKPPGDVNPGDPRPSGNPGDPNPSSDPGDGGGGGNPGEPNPSNDPGDGGGGGNPGDPNPSSDPGDGGGGGNPGDPSPSGNPGDPSPSGNPGDPSPSGNPNDPNPNDPNPNDPNPNDPNPNDPNPNDPNPNDPNPNDPNPNDPNPNDPNPNDPNPNDPNPGDGNGDDGSRRQDTDDNTVTFPNLDDDEEYELEVISNDDNGSGNGEKGGPYRTKPALPTPTNVDGRTTESTMEIRWDGVNGADAYLVKLSRGGNDRGDEYEVTDKIGRAHV
jgi:hypothetical protein